MAIPKIKQKKIHFLITAGGTREYIDPVRFISNASSGKMGYALAREADKRGHKVTLISASEMQPPVGVDFMGVESAAEMFTAVKKFFPVCDCLVMAAAVSDYAPVKCSKTKIKKNKKSFLIKLKPTVDILKWAGSQKLRTKNTKQKAKIIIGFALEDKNLKANAEKKLKEKNLDMIIANKPDSIGSEESSVFIKAKDKSWLEVKMCSKQKVAKKIIGLLERRF